jgi:hypothetical protein
MILISRKKLKLLEERSYWEGVVEGRWRVRDMLTKERAASELVKARLASRQKVFH